MSIASQSPRYAMFRVAVLCRERPLRDNSMCALRGLRMYIASMCDEAQNNTEAGTGKDVEDS